jgi:ELWxxDGT repeat protein
MANGLLFFDATDGTSGNEPMVSDGTAAGTVLLLDAYPGTSSSSPAEFTEFAGRTWFNAFNGTSVTGTGRELYVSDGTPAGTSLFLDVNPGTNSGVVADLTVFKGRLYFTATVTSVSGNELWVTDGTLAGTALFLDINPGSTSSNPTNLLVVGDLLFFTASDGTNGTELWKSDGTPAGTSLVRDINLGSLSASPGNLTDVGGVLYFSANDGVSGVELWKSDGTLAGTTQVADIHPLGSSSPRFLTALGAKLLFAADNGTSGLEPWISDGTLLGTTMLKDIGPGSESGMSTSGWFVTLPGAARAVFGADDLVSGPELWRTDGTTAGTVLHQDLRPGVAVGSSPTRPGLGGATLYFGANDGATGVELYGMASMAAAIPYGAGCPGTGGLVPEISGVNNPPALGNAAFQIGLSRALPSSAAALVLSANRTRLVLAGGCIVHVDPAFFVFAQAVATNGAGEGAVSIPVPNDPSLRGLQVFGQYFALDSNGAFQGTLSFTPGLKVILFDN